MQQTLELITENFHSLITHDFNADGISEIILARINKGSTDIGIIHPKALSNYSIRIGDYINSMCITKTSLQGEFELVTGDQKGVVRINPREGKPFFSKDIRDGIRLPSAILSLAPGDLNGNKLSEIVVGCKNGEVVMVERVPGKKYKWDAIRGFSLGQIFQNDVMHTMTGDFNGNGQIGFIVGSKTGLFKEIEFRPQLQKFDLINEFSVETEPSFCFVGDFDRDGITEVMIGEYSGRFSVFKRSKLMSTHNFDGVITSGTVGDVDNDRILEVIVGTSNGSFHILRQNTVESYEGYGNISDLKVGDIIGNKLNDLVFSIDKRRIVAFTVLREKLRERPNVDLLPYGPTGIGVKRTSQLPDTKEIYCPNCKSEAKFIEEYRRWYCYTCRQYIAPVAKDSPEQKIHPLIDPQKHGTPYEVNGYPPNSYQPYPQTQQGAYAPEPIIEKIVKETPITLGAVDKQREFRDEKQTQNEQVEANYFLPLDLEADLDTGAAFFNDILKIKHIILIHSQSGVPLFSQGFGKEIDVSLTSGFLSAVGTFTEEMAGETEKRIGVFSEIGREGFWISIYEGYESKAAFLISEKISNHLKQRISIFMKEFENIYAKELENFSGFVSAFSNTSELLEKHLRVEYLYPLKVDSKRMRLTAITSTEKKVAQTYSEHVTQKEEEVFYVNELLEILFEKDLGVSKDEALKTLIKYLENGMLIPLPPPPDEVM